MTGTPPQSASSVGLPGRSAIPCAQMPGLAQPGDDGGGLVAGAHRRARPTRRRRRWTATASRSDGRERVVVVGDDPARVGLAARVAHERGERRPRSRRGPGRRRAPRSAGSTTSSPVDTIATRGRAWTRTSVTPAAASSPRSCARSGRPAGTSSAPAARVLVGAHQAVARRRRAGRPRSSPASPPACARP